MTDVFDGIIPVCDIIRQHDDDNYYCSHEFSDYLRDLRENRMANSAPFIPMRYIDGIAKW